MTSASTRIVVFTLIVNLLFRVAAAPFSAQDILDIFGNPFDDIKKSIQPNSKADVSNNYLIGSTTQKIRKENDPDTTMIIVPPNSKTCQSGAQKDINGVYREPL